MSTTPLIRYQLDPSGSSPDNAVIGEVKTLSLTQIRAVAPQYGPFFTESLTVYDNGTGRLLSKDVDYKVVEMLQTATMKFGKEIAQLILIVNPAVSGTVRYNYQTLGGLYQNSSEDLVNMYNTIMSDNRPVDFINVLNKPVEYPPTLHRHMLEDVYGFEPVVVQMERIRQAIILGDVPAFEALVDWVKNNSGTSVMIDSGLTSITRLQTKTFQISTSNNKNGTLYFWNIEHQGTADENFVDVSGSVSIFQNRASFTIKTSAKPPVGNQVFNIIIRRDEVTGPIMTTIEGVTFKGSTLHPLTDGPMSTAALLRSCCIFKPNIRVNARSMYLAGE